MSADRTLAVVGFALSLVGIGIPIAFPHLSAVVGWLFLIGGVGSFASLASNHFLRRRESTREDWHEMERRFGLIESELEGCGRDTTLRWSVGP